MNSGLEHFTQIKSYMFLKSGKVQRNTDNSANTTQTCNDVQI